MATKAFRKVRLLFAFAALSLVWPAVAAAQETGIGVSVQGAIGSHIGDGGDTQSIGLGVSFGERFGVVVNAERSHVPTDVTFFEDGYAATRGGTTRFVSGEFRYVPITYKRLSPYVLVGVGRGVSRPNVNEFFPDRVTHTVTLLFPGFGVRVLADRTPERVRGRPVHVPEPSAASRTPAGSPHRGPFLAWRLKLRYGRHTVVSKNRDLRIVRGPELREKTSSQSRIAASPMRSITSSSDADQNGVDGCEEGLGVVLVRSSTRFHRGHRR